MEEITFIWYRPKALSAMLFLLNRYVALLGNVYGLLINFVPVPEELSEIFVVQRTPPFWSTIHRLPKCLLIWMVVVVIALAGVAFSTNGFKAGIFGHSSSTVIVMSGVICYESDVIVTPAGPGLAWVALFAYELFIFVLTLSRIFKIRGMLRSPYLIMSRKNTVDIIFQDGKNFVVSVPEILIQAHAVRFSEHTAVFCDYFLTVGKDINKFTLATFTSCISVTLVSRLTLNLHKSIDTGIFTTPIQDDNHDSYILTTRVSIHAQTLISY
ncbi:uncharacterized protein F5147DRAFT_651793 [Suillus discolor]|uniref:Uncharacterized protein n=1 Tax=Suillus discolor TaxID=1912936 RepID=A0A9P7FB45_9AGAM|nr:uncharacterized protein F5147DRAFT_651793 [Suillus discolor]KAG2110614.1 hypothetical protein F5147DRAFT_651793 [Suillus discolor]